MRRHNESSMRFLHEAWQSSGLSKKLFAIEQGLSPSTFYYWVTKFEKLTASSSKTSGEFEQIKLDGTVSSSVTATIRYPLGVVLEWHGGSDTIDDLKSLL
ncbi:MAG: hypothetical protein AAGA18_16060 [Verrucomicrobiota bacterium]